MAVIGFLCSFTTNPRFVSAFQRGPGEADFVRRNAREAVIICALGLVMFAYVAAFVPPKHWGHVSKSEIDATQLISDASANHLNEVRLLLAHGADKYARTKEGFTAFDFAAYNKNEPMARLLWIGLSAMNDAALKAAMDESYSKMRWSVCQFMLSRRPEHDPSPRNVFQTDLDVNTSPLLSHREQLSRCRNWVRRHQMPQWKNAVPFDKAPSLY